MSPEELGNLLQIELTPFTESNPARCALAAHSTQYVIQSGKIVGLNLFGQTLKKSPNEWLPQLPYLQYLNLGNCELQSCDLRQQTQLRVLFLQRNPDLNILQLPTTFPALLRADLGHCALSAINWPDSPLLEFLNVSRQEGAALRSWSFATASPRLYYCDLSHNGLTEFQLPAGCDNLTILALEKNQLVSVEFAGDLVNLESLRLGNNQLKTVNKGWLEKASGLLNLFLEGNDIEVRYQTFIEGKTPHQVVESLRNVLRNEALGTAKNDECKVLLIGNGKAGKSCIVHRLEHDEFKQEWDSTHGIELFPYESGEWKLKFWDFGGQDIYHATHRLFMQSNVVYLLVWSKETDPRINSTLDTPQGDDVIPYRNYSIPYWLHYARTLGSNSPIILVQTHKGKDGTDNLSYLTLATEEQQMPILHQIESNSDDWDANGYDDLLRHIERSVKAIKAAEGDRTAINYLEMRQWLRERETAGVKVLPLTDYLTKAADLKIQGADDLLASWLHKTGVLFYQPDLTHDYIILNQRWAIRAIYTLFDRQEPHFQRLRNNGGVFTGWELRQIWRDWDQAQPERFVDFMLACEVCFELPLGEEDFDYRSFLAPGLLPEPPLPEVAAIWENTPHWELHYRYPILHYGTIQSLLVQTRGLASLQLMSQVSTYLTEGGQQATILATRDEEYLNRLVVKIGQNDFALHDAIETLLLRLDASEPDLLLRDPQSGELVPWSRIEAAFRYGNPKVESESGQYVDKEGFTSFWQARKQEPSKPAEGFVPLEESRALVRVPKGKMLPKMPTPQAWTDAAQLAVNTATEATTTNHKTILFATANPSGTAKLQLSKEYRAVSQYLEDQNYYRFCSRSRLSPGEFVDAVYKFRPHILHFSGHGKAGRPELRALETQLGQALDDQAGLVFNDDDHRGSFVLRTEVIKRLFTRFQQAGVPLELVVLNACHSHSHAQAISELGLTVIGTSTVIEDSAAIAFASGLYSQLGEQAKLTTAIQHGITKAEAYGLGATQVQVFQNGSLIHQS